MKFVLPFVQNLLSRLVRIDFVKSLEEGRMVERKEKVTHEEIVKKIDGFELKKLIVDGEEIYRATYSKVKPIMQIFMVALFDMKNVKILEEDENKIHLTCTFFSKGKVNEEEKIIWESPGEVYFEKKIEKKFGREKVWYLLKLTYTCGEKQLTSPHIIVSIAHGVVKRVAIYEHGRRIPISPLMFPKPLLPTIGIFTIDQCKVYDVKQINYMVRRVKTHEFHITSNIEESTTHVLIMPIHVVPLPPAILYIYANIPMIQFKNIQPGNYITIQMKIVF